MQGVHSREVLKCPGPWAVGRLWARLARRHAPPHWLVCPPHMQYMLGVKEEAPCPLLTTPRGSAQLTPEAPGRHWAGLEEVPLDTPLQGRWEGIED